MGFQDGFTKRLGKKVNYAEHHHYHHLSALNSKVGFSDYCHLLKDKCSYKRLNIQELHGLDLRRRENADEDNTRNTAQLYKRTSPVILI